MCGHSEVVLMLEVRGGWQTMLMMISPWACRSTLPSMPERRIRYLVAFSWGAVFRRLPRATQSVPTGRFYFSATAKALLCQNLRHGLRRVLEFQDGQMVKVETRTVGLPSIAIIAISDFCRFGLHRCPAP